VVGHGGVLSARGPHAAAADRGVGAELGGDLGQDPARVWALYAQAPEPLGYDFHAIWPEGPAAEGAALLRLEPWRLHVADAMTAATPRVWKPDTAYR
jgi:hypothetical protein